MISEQSHRGQGNGGCIQPSKLKIVLGFYEEDKSNYTLDEPLVEPWAFDSAYLYDETETILSSLVLQSYVRFSMRNTRVSTPRKHDLNLGPP